MNLPRLASPDAVALLLRLSLGSVFLAHGLLLKVFTYGFEGTLGFFASLGLPAIAAYLVIFGEILGGLALIFGVLVRPAALGLALIAFGSIWPHASAGWLFSNPGGGWEFPLFLAVASLAQAMLGAGRYRLALPAFVPAPLRA